MWRLWSAWRVLAAMQTEPVPGVLVDEGDGGYDESWRHEHERGRRPGGGGAGATVWSGRFHAVGIEAGS